MTDILEDMKFTILQGEVFKELLGFFKFYKLTLDPEIEKNQLLKDGMNMIPLNQRNGHCDGGIVFNIQENLFKSAIGNTFKYKNIREVEIPNDATIFIDFNSLRSDKLFFKEKINLENSDIWNDINFCKETLMYDNAYLNFIKNPPYELLDWILSKRPSAIEYVNNPPNDLIIKVLSESPYMIRHVKNPSIEHYLLAYEKNVNSIQYIDIKENILEELIKIKPEIKTLRERKNSHYINYNGYSYVDGIWKRVDNDHTYQFINSEKKYKEETEEESAKEIRKNPFHIYSVKTQTQDLCNLAYSLNKETFKYIDPKYLNVEMCNEAVQSNYKMLNYVPEEYIKSLDTKIILLALEKDGKLIDRIHEPTYEMCFAAVMNNPEAIYNIKDKPKEIMLMLARTNSKYYHLFDEIPTDDPVELKKIISEYPVFYSKLKSKTKELTEIAIGKIPELLKYVPEELQDEELCAITVLIAPKTLQNIIKQTDKICMNAVTIDGLCLRYVKNKTNEICWKALQTNPLALEFITDQTEEMCLFAIKKSVRSIEFVKTITENILELALELSPFLIKEAVSLCPELLTSKIIKTVVTKNSLLLKHIPKELISSEICYAALDNNPEVLEYIDQDFVTNDLILKAIRKNGNVIRFVANNKQTENVCIEAVNSQPFSLRFISFEKQTESVCMAALNKDVLSFEHIKHKKPEYCFFAVGKNPSIMSYINSKDEILYQMCLCINPKGLHYIKDIDMRSIGTELLHEIENIILSMISHN
ncbi:hypothetical protein Indivirus_8_2 [Indivirus ILV1]|uniref:DUF4116 domain-containing protein n=1 Tax=Indivirus ILV1 TaxID=1977633 RepID=A0A1V0SE81_9VIRU|nr:hypothetical protein Indivirus_8_2 [Indivirus ILV1]